MGVLVYLVAVLSLVALAAALCAPASGGYAAGVVAPAAGPGKSLEPGAGTNFVDSVSGTFPQASITGTANGAGLGYAVDLDGTNGETLNFLLKLTNFATAFCPTAATNHIVLSIYPSADPTTAASTHTVTCASINTGNAVQVNLAFDNVAPNTDPGFYYLAVESSTIATGGSPTALQLQFQFCSRALADATVYGDPHFTGFRGQQFDFHGKGDSVYHLYSDDEIMVNGKFSAWNTVGVVGSTFISGVGVRLRDLKVEYNMLPLTSSEREWAANVTDQLRELPEVELVIASRLVSLKRGHRLELGNCSSATFDGVLLRLQYGEYSVRVWHHISLGVPFLNVEMGIRRERMNKLNGGLLGLTTRTKDVDVNEAHHLVRAGGLLGTSATSAHFHLRPASYLDSSDCPLPSYEAASVSTRQPGVGAADGLSA